ncbi:MAG: Fe-S cluster assembly protein IscX [Phycisphaerae bacterium]|nr:Fe-S cluster assembly protein IscX [Phycisphaerae bacterium]
MGNLKWSNADEIGFQLGKKFPGLDPLSVRFTDLHKRVTALADFDDDPAASNESLLEAIQMAWLEYFRDRQ